MTRMNRGTFSLWWWFGAPWQQGRTPRTAPPVVVALAHGQRLRFWPAATGQAATTLVLVPGLHMDGPADTRMDRVARIFAGAGLHVVAPHLESFEHLWIRDDRTMTSARDATLAASDWARSALPPQRQVVFSVSFGSVPAMHLMAERDIAHGVLFGGLADLRHTLRFALDGERNPGRDPLNGPAIYRNLAATWLEASEVPRFEAACRNFCQQTWSRSNQPAIKDRKRFVHALHEAARGLGGDGRQLLFEATGLLPGGAARLQAALEGPAFEGGPFAWADPRRLAGRIANMVDVVHGRSDDVIPADSAAMLGAMLPSARVSLTGRWSHTGVAAPGGGDKPGIIDEMSGNIGVLRALASLVGGNERTWDT